MPNKSHNKYSAFEVFTIHTLIQSGLSYEDTNAAYNELRTKDKLPPQPIPQGTYDMIKTSYTPIIKAQPNPAHATTLQALKRFSIAGLHEHYKV